MRASAPATVIAGLLSCLALGCGGAQKLVRGSPTPGGHFGRSMAVAGSTVVIGAPDEAGASASGAGAGAAYVSVEPIIDKGIWNAQARLTAPQPAGGEHFGAAVSVSGATVAVGAPGTDRAGMSKAGAVYLFVRAADGTWALQKAIYPPSPEANLAYGSSVWLDGDRLVVGAPGRTQGTTKGAGAAYVYERSGTTWGSRVDLGLGSPAAGDGFGASVAVLGTTVFVGAPHRDTNATTDSGAVTVFDKSGSAWSQTATLRAPDRQSFDLFGSSLAATLVVVSGGNIRRLVIGSPYADLPGPINNTGAAYLFEAPDGGGSFAQTQKLTAGDAAPGDLFASAVAASQQRVVIGAPLADSATASSTGAGYVFDFAGGAWSQTAKVTSTTPESAGNFGAAVATSAATTLVAAPNEDTFPSVDAGSVHVMIDPLSDPGSQAMRLAAARRDTLNLAPSQPVALSADTLVIASTTGLDILRKDPAAWSLAQTIAIGGIVTAVAIDGDRLAVATIDATATFSKHVDIYVRAGTGPWSWQQQLAPDFGTMTEDAIGAIALQGTVMVLADWMWSGLGRVIIYDTTSWTPLQAPLESASASTSEDDLQFGIAIALDGDTLLLAEAPYIDAQSTAPRYGQVHIFGRNGTGPFALTGTLTAPAPVAGDLFGSGIALSGELLAVCGGGASLRVYRRNSQGLFDVTWETTNDNFVAGGGTVVMQGDAMAVGAPGTTVSGFLGAGEISLYQRQPDDSWTLAGAIDAPDPAASVGLGLHLATAGDQLIAPTGVGVYVFHP
jgi:hypothetical protein